MITLKKIPHFEHTLTELYKQAFPKNERKPILLINLLIKRKKCEFLAIQKDGESVGFFIVLKNASLALVDYFAIKSSARNLGYGAKALEALKQYYDGKRIVMEIESVLTDTQNKDIRIRRKKFYARNGFVSTGTELYIYKERMELIYNESDTPVPTFDEYSALLKDTLGTLLYAIVNPTKI